VKLGIRHWASGIRKTRFMLGNEDLKFSKGAPNGNATLVVKRLMPNT
jgi:hypothetical protein